IQHGMTLRRYWSTAACQGCAIKSQCTPSKERRITRWEHEHVVEEVQRRLDSDPDAMRTRRETVEHPFGTIKARMGATHFLMKRLRNVAAAMARRYNHFGRLLDDRTREHRRPATIGDHGRVRLICLHTTKTRN